MYRTYKAIEFLFNNEQKKELEITFEKEMMSEELLDPRVQAYIIKIIREAKELGKELYLEEVRDLSLIYIDTISKCLHNDIPVEYLKNDNKFKQYDDSQLLVIQDGIENNVDIRLFAKDVNNDSAIMNNSLLNILDERNKQVRTNQNRKFSKRLEREIASFSIFKYIKLKLFGGMI